MEKYDKNKLIVLQNRNREIRAAYGEISDDRRHYMSEAKKLKALLVEADRQGALKGKRQNMLVKIGKFEGQENKPVKDGVAFVPLHAMPLNEVLSNVKGHPTEPYINSGTLREYIRISEEYNRLDEHFQDLATRSQEASRVVDECMGFLKNNGFSETDIPMK